MGSRNLGIKRCVGENLQVEYMLPSSANDDLADVPNRRGRPRGLAEVEITARVVAL